MTNEEKTKEIVESQPFAFFNDNYQAMIAWGADKMAEWKDQQFKSVLESEIESMKLDYPDTATIQIRRYLEGLVEKLFKED